MMRSTTYMACLMLSPVAFALDGASLRLQDAAEGTHTQPDSIGSSRISNDAVASERPARGFLDKGTRRWSINLAYADNWDDPEEIQTSITYHAFIEQRVEVVVDFAVRNINQVGDNVVGFNPSIGFRWHFWKSDDDATWTAFTDVGIGVMASTSDVPEDGTSFNFTPRAGIGLTWQCMENARLIAGLRWSHISNGRIYGNDDNPGIDTPMLHVGVMFSF